MWEMAPNRSTLQCTIEGLDESYKEYDVKWKETASLVELPLINREINSLCVDTLLSPNYDKLIGNAISILKKG